MHIFPNSDPRNNPPNKVQDLYQRLLEAAEKAQEEFKDTEEVVLHEPPDTIQTACKRLQDAMVDIFEELGIRPTNANAVYVTGIISVSILQQGEGYSRPGNEEHTDVIRKFATLITFIHNLNS